MIDLTVAQIADIVGGTLSDIAPQDAAQRHVTGTVEFDSRAVGPGGLFLRSEERRVGKQCRSKWWPYN